MGKQGSITYRQWLDNEYRLWTEALQESTANNFKEHTMVKRMLSEDVEFPLELRPELSMDELERIAVIDQIGRSSVGITDVAWRMVYYADLILRREPSSLVEIGGGVGEFYAVIGALGYRGDYYIYDLPDVSKFQIKYLAEVEWQTGLHLPVGILHHEFCVSFYALGEFDDDTKDWYIKNVLKECPHGMIAWNPHSGASEEIPFECEVMEQYDGSKLLTW